MPLDRGPARPRRGCVPWRAAIAAAACLVSLSSSPAGHCPGRGMARAWGPAAGPDHRAKAGAWDRGGARVRVRLRLRLRGGASVPVSVWHTALLQASAGGARSDLSLEDASAALRQHGLSVSAAQVRELLRLSGAAEFERVQEAHFVAALAAHPPTSALGRWQQVCMPAGTCAPSLPRARCRGHASPSANGLALWAESTVPGGVLARAGVAAGAPHRGGGCW